MTSEILISFSHENYSVTHDAEPFAKLTNHTLNAETHFLSEISEAASIVRNKASKLWHENPKKCDSTIDSFISMQHMLVKKN